MDTPAVHGCFHHKHLLRCLGEKGVRTVRRKEEPPPGTLLCMVHVGGNGCGCGARWRAPPRDLIGLLGGKVSLCKLLAAERLQSVAPLTFDSLRSWQGRDQREEGAGAKWFLKISHQCSRRGMMCSKDPAKLAEYAESIPRHVRYVIQKEVPRPLTIERRKCILRQWVVLTVDGRTPGVAWLHVSRRLRVNRLTAEYSSNDASDAADMVHESENAFPDSRQWALYEPVWTMCADISTRVVSAALRRFRADSDRQRQRPYPPPSGGWLNVFGMDFVVSERGEELVPVLLEVNIDPGFQNKCTETLAAAEDLTDFCLQPLAAGEELLLPDGAFDSTRESY